MKIITLLAAFATFVMMLMQIYYCIANIIRGDFLIVVVIFNLLYALGYGLLSAFFFLLSLKLK